MPKCIINGHEIEVEEGQSLIEAFKKLEEKIAHYCWHPGLSVAGVCRLCLVEIEGQDKLQIACNTKVQEGMKATNQSEKVKEAVRWGLDFHLINHPLDCPICDQAGECGLQEQYMDYGTYDSSMSQPKVRKKKVVDLGSKIVLDSERCILCARCVRFTDEVTQTHELGIFNRGDRSEVGTFEGQALENDYALNTVDICPVGALTSKDFRFKQRVWYLKNTVTTCQGCSTGCKVKVYHNKEGLFRVQPVEDHEVNGHWMCDQGREIYKFVNLASRIQTPFQIKRGVGVPLDQKQIQQYLNQTFFDKNKKIAVVLTGQNTNEEYQALKVFLDQEAQAFTKVFYWQNNQESFEDFDGLLIRGDKNPNTKGLKSEFKDLASYEDLKTSKWDAIFVVAPENISVYPDYLDKIQDLADLQIPLIFLGSQSEESLFDFPEDSLVLPAKTFFEKQGSFTNYKGLIRKVQKGQQMLAEALDLEDFVHLVRGEFQPRALLKTRKNNEMIGS